MKVVENSQRDINIAFMNELSIIFNRMGIDTKSVLEAAGTTSRTSPAPAARAPRAAMTGAFR